MKQFYDLMKKVPLLTGIVGVVLGINSLFEGNESRGYVLEGAIESEGTVLNMGVVALSIALFEFVFMIILTIVMIRVLKTIDFKKIREEW